MSTISPAAVKALRDKTNAPMMECKAALTEAQGNMDKAVDLIRLKFAGIQAKRGDREAAEGRIAVFIDPKEKVGAILEMRCESAPVAKNEHFVQMANDVVRQVALKDPSSVDDLMAQPFIGDEKKTVKDRVGEVVGLIRENMKPARLKRMTGTLGSYVHHDGTVGVLLQVEGKDTADEQALRDVCMHITARNPVSARREDVPEDILAKEKELATQQALETGKGKPASIVEKIAEGKLRTWLQENVLNDQKFVKDETKTVSEYLKGFGLQVVNFVRYKVGEK